MIFPVSRPGTVDFMPEAKTFRCEVPRKTTNNKEFRIAGKQLSEEATNVGDLSRSCNISHIRLKAPRMMHKSDKGGGGAKGSKSTIFATHDEKV